MGAGVALASALQAIAVTTDMLNADSRSSLVGFTNIGNSQTISGWFCPRRPDFPRLLVQLTDYWHSTGEVYLLRLCSRSHDQKRLFLADAKHIFKESSSGDLAPSFAEGSFPAPVVGSPAVRKLATLDLAQFPLKSPRYTMGLTSVAGVVLMGRVDPHMHELEERASREPLNKRRSPGSFQDVGANWVVNLSIWCVFGRFQGRLRLFSLAFRASYPFRVHCPLGYAVRSFSDRTRLVIPSIIASLSWFLAKPRYRTLIPYFPVVEYPLHGPERMFHLGSYRCLGLLCPLLQTPRQ